MVLIKSVLTSLPTYFLSQFTIPGSVEMKIEQSQRDFLWGRSNQSDGMHLVA